MNNSSLSSVASVQMCAYFFSYSLLRIITDGSESESTYPWPKLCTNINYIAPLRAALRRAGAAAPELLLTAAAVHLCAPVSLLYDLSITTNHRLHIAVGQHYKKKSSNHDYENIQICLFTIMIFFLPWDSPFSLIFYLANICIYLITYLISTYLVLCWLVITKDDKKLYRKVIKTWFHAKLIISEMSQKLTIF